MSFGDVPGNSILEEAKEINLAACIDHVERGGEGNAKNRNENGECGEKRPVAACMAMQHNVMTTRKVVLDCWKYAVGAPDFVVVETYVPTTPMCPFGQVPGDCGRAFIGVVNLCVGRCGVAKQGIGEVVGVCHSCGVMAGDVELGMW